MSGGRRRASLRAPLRRAGVLALLAAGLLAGGAGGAAAQVGRPRPSRPPRPAPSARDTTARRDTTKQDTTQLVKWAPEDSVMKALLEREGYVTTRYQGNRVVFQAQSHDLVLQGDAAVGREKTVLVGDTVFYNDSTDLVRAVGPRVVLRDPARGEDVVARGYVTYNIAERRATASNVTTAVTSGEQWFVTARRTGILAADSSTAQETGLYARGGSLTTCDDSIPDYHFQAKEIKVVQGRILVARPAVLYIADVPVAWLPFVFQDLRKGRRSGMLTPRFGLADVVRNSPTYRRHIDNLGYYFALSDYADASIALDWLSGARPRGTGDLPGWTRVNGQLRYAWRDRFLSGGMSLSQQWMRDGRSNLALSWQHSQDFSQSSRLSMDVNYVTSTQLQRQTSLNAYQAMATIQSRLNYTQKVGPAQIAFGGSQRQYPGRAERDVDLPTLNVSTGPLNLASWLVWTPSLGITNSRQLHQDQFGRLSPRFRLDPLTGALDSAFVSPSTRSSSLNFGTPLRIFGFTWNNSFTVNDQTSDAPNFRDIVRVDAATGDTTRERRYFARTYLTAVDWQTSISLPQISQGRWNISPSVGIVNVDPGAFWVRSEMTGATFYHQSKRLQYGLSASPTFYGLFPGFLGFTRFRQSIQPQITYNFAPAAHVDTAYLRATNRQPGAETFSGIRQNQVTLRLSQTLEAKRRATGDSAAAEGGSKLKLLALDFDAISYNFERYRIARMRNPQARRSAGFATDNWGFGARSDLLPNFDLRVGYSLFQGSLTTDTARFAPYRTDITARFSMNQQSNPLSAIFRVFGRAVPSSAPALAHTPPTPEDSAAQRVADSPLAGASTRPTPEVIPPKTTGWSASIGFTSSRPRPVTGNNVVLLDPTAQCRQNYPFGSVAYQLCVDQATGQGTGGLAQTSAGGIYYQSPARENIDGNLTFALTPNWSAQWSTNYDFQLHQFANQSVTLRRELHDWNAVFSFIRAPNGNFSFHFFVALKAEPDLKFDYNRNTYRNNQGGTYSPYF